MSCTFVTHVCYARVRARVVVHAHATHPITPLCPLRPSWRSCDHLCRSVGLGGQLDVSGSGRVVSGRVESALAAFLSEHNQLLCTAQAV